MLVVDMIESLVPCVGTFSRESHDTIAEAAPEAALAVMADSVGFDAGLDRGTRDVDVFAAEVATICVLGMEDLAAGGVV